MDFQNFLKTQNLPHFLKIISSKVKIISLKLFFLHDFFSKRLKRSVTSELMKHALDISASLSLTAHQRASS